MAVNQRIVDLKKLWQVLVERGANIAGVTLRTNIGN
jgi:hypothetical protein